MARSIQFASERVSEMLQPGMYNSNIVSTLLERGGTLVLDGALATELERRGHNLNHPLWSAIILLEQPTSVYQLHLDYFLAGADIAITASYQASFQGLREHLGFSNAQSADLIRTSVSLAKQARGEAYRQGVERALLIAGSIGPYGAYLSDGSEYRGDYELNADEFKDFHRRRIEVTVDAGVDVLACETMPSFAELHAILELLAADFATTPTWVSCTLKDAEHLSDSTPITQVLDAINKSPQIVAVGVNCVPEAIVTGALKHLRTLTDKPLLCYPNSGEVYDGVRKTWAGQRAQGPALVDKVEEWKAAGARLIGGCCRTGPVDVEVIAAALQR